MRWRRHAVSPQRSASGSSRSASARHPACVSASRRCAVVQLCGERIRRCRTMLARTTAWYCLKSPRPLTNGCRHSHSHRSPASSGTAAANTSSFRRGTRAQARIVSRCRGSSTHCTNRSTARSTTSPSARCSAFSGRARARSCTSSGNPIDSWMTASTTSGSVTPRAASSARVSASVNTSNGTSATCARSSAQSRSASSSRPAITTMTFCGSGPNTSPSRSRSHSSRERPVSSQVSKNSTTQGCRSHSLPSSATNA